MARCYYLEYYNPNFFGYANDKYICKLCRKQFETNDPHVRYVCNAECGEEYKNCPIYKERR